MMKSLMLVSCFVAAVVCQYNNIGQGDRPNVNGQTVPDDTCVLWGDPHFWTFDSTVYSYQDPGWHHIVVSPTVNVQGNFVPGCWTPDPSNACVQGIRIFVLDDNNVVNTMEVYNLNHAQDGYYQVNKNSAFYQILINGKDVGLHSTWNGQTTTTDRIQPGVGINIGSASNAFAYYYTAQGNTLFQIKVQVNTDIVISYIPQVLTITPLNGSRGNSWWKQICGLCGNFNGAAGDDFLVHGTTNNSIALKDENVLRFGNTWAIDYQAAGAPPPVSTDAPINQQGVFTCNFQPNPTQPPTSPPATQPPTPTRAPPTPAPTPGPTTPGSPTPAPTPSATPAPTPGPTPAPTPSATPRPVPTPSPSATPGPTFPPTQPPTQPPTDTPTPSPTQPSNTTYNYTNVDNSTAVINAKGTPIYDEAVTSCANAGLLQGDPLWVSCMYDVTQTNTTSLAVASAGALVLAGCAKTSLNDSTCVAQTLFACPGACNANGACLSGKCQCNKGYEGDTCTKAPLLTAAQLAGVISAGAVAGIAIGAAAFAGLAGFGAKKGYDYYQMRDNKMANVNSNPLYNEKKTGGVSPLYTEKA